MTSLHIDRVDPADDAAVASWNETQRAAYTAGREAVWWTPTETALEQLRTVRPGHIHGVFVARTDEGIVGAAEAIARPDEPAEAEIGVLPEYRRRGIGTALARAVHDALAGHEPGVVQTELYTDAGLTFARRVGMEPGNVEHVQLLDLPVPATALEALDRPNPRVTTRSWVGPCPEDVVDDWAQLTEQMEEDVPMGTLTRAVTPTDRDRIRRNEERMDAQGYDLVRTLAQLDGESVGYTVIFVSRHDPEIVIQDDTLVDRDHRGHGVGRALKIANLQQLRDVPAARDSRWVQTWTATTNEPMLALNRAVGFRIADTMHHCEGRIDALPAAGV